MIPQTTWKSAPQRYGRMCVSHKSKTKVHIGNASVRRLNFEQLAVVFEPDETRSMVRSADALRVVPHTFVVQGVHVYVTTYV